ncbi:uncharacterized protein SRS1_17128 [Sporisorium reilianum f. sp. reilianum]|uniref:Uncharacterized protein n=1 Tax=Sporisorium reilianum f. sp. reilianum TaxID=72559 RepID=A0A2N8UDK9_9BASI|nr:uncharacterized protein SRS1_17128 [Sporisorium reilianum f. sp. reilianum]
MADPSNPANATSPPTDSDAVHPDEVLFWERVNAARDSIVLTKAQQDQLDAIYADVRRKREEGNIPDSSLVFPEIDGETKIKRFREIVDEERAFTNKIITMDADAPAEQYHMAVRDHIRNIRRLMGVSEEVSGLNASVLPGRRRTDPLSFHWH